MVELDRIGAGLDSKSITKHSGTGAHRFRIKRLSRRRGAMADEEQAEQSTPLVPKLGVADCALCGYIGCKCCCFCCLAFLCLLATAASISFIYTFGKSECGRAGDFPRAMCNPVTSPCNASTGWECRVLGGCVYGPAVGKMSTSQLSLFYRAEFRICWRFFLFPAGCIHPKWGRCFLFSRGCASQDAHPRNVVSSRMDRLQTMCRRCLLILHGEWHLARFRN